MLDAGRRERSEGASREERRTDFHQGGFSGQWKSNWNYCLMTETRKVENGSFSEKPTAAAAGGGVCVCGACLRNVCSPREAKGLACGGQEELASRISTSTSDGWPGAAEFAYRSHSFPTRPRAPSSLYGEQGTQWLGTGALKADHCFSNPIFYRLLSWVKLLSVSIFRASHRDDSSIHCHQSILRMKCREKQHRAWHRARPHTSCHYRYLLRLHPPLCKRLTVVQLLSRAIPWTAAHQTSLFYTISLSLFKLMPIESVMPSNHLILCRPPLLLPLIFPSIRVFSTVRLTVAPSNS